jgi:hypothetical protein
MSTKESTMKGYLTAAFALFASVATSAAAMPATEAANWRQDLQVLATGLSHAHPNPFHKVRESDWRAALAALDASLPSLSHNQAVVGVMRLVAMIGEGHTAINPLFRAQPGFHYLPIRLYQFADGLYVRGADPAHAQLVGARVLRIGTMDAAAAFQAVSTVAAHDNDSGARNGVPQFMAIPEILDGLGISPAESVTLELEKEGQRFIATLAPAGLLEPHGHRNPFVVLPEGWIDARRGSVPTPLWQSDPTNLYWSTAISGEKTQYIQYNGVADKDADPLSHFFPKAIEEADRSGAEKLVIDVRANGGGNSFLNRPILKSLIRSRFDHHGRLFVIIGRGTFSAAQNFVNDLANWTEAIFVGEPTASNPNQYGDHVEVALPSSGLVVMVSTLYHQTAGPQDHRQWTAPQIPTELTFAQYRDGIDPALEAALRYRSITDALTPTLAAGGAELERTYRAFKSDPATSWIPTEAEINALGYLLLAQNDLKRALEIFGLNVESYPQSANAHDSLGEAYLRAGDHAHARESYERSLALNPGNDNARRMLERLKGGSAAH